MRLKLTCKSCSRHIEIEGDTTASAIKCPNCDGTIQLPSNILDVDSTLGGFKINRHLGSGSMGCVYLATQISMDRDVAVKVLPPEIKEREEELDNFLKEVRLLAKLDHPNIVTAFEAGEADGNYYMAMTYVEGETLEDKITRDGPLDEVDALSVTHKIAEALKYAWEKHHILHRDVKPENIMLDERSKEPKLLDMGISRALNEETEESSDQGILVGTPHYMSPEQANARDDIDFRSDMYSLGCSLYQFLTGKVPFDAEHVMQVLSKHALDPIPSPRKHNPNLHATTVELLHRMMAKRPSNRYESWDELLKQIRKTINAVKRNSSKASPKNKKHGAGVRKTVVDVEMSDDDFSDKDDDSLDWLKEPDKKGDGPKGIDLTAVKAETAPENMLIKRLVVVIAVMLGVAILFFGGMKIKTMLSSSSPDPVEDDGGGLSETDAEVQRRTEDARRKLEAAKAAKVAKAAADSQADADRIKQLRERFQRLVRNEPPKPVAFRPLFINYRKFLSDVEGTPVEPEVQSHLKELRKRQEVESAQVMTDLKRQAAAYLKDRNYAAAIEHYESYAGHCAGETRDERVALVAKLKQQQTKLKGSKNVQHMLVERVAYHLSQGDYNNVETDIKDAQEKGVLDDELIRFIRSVAAIDTVILKSYEEQIGQELVVSLRKGKVTLSITGVKGNSVKAVKNVKIGESTGRLPRDFKLSEVHPSELVRRLSGVSHDIQPIMKGLLALQSRKYTTARSYFTSAPHPLSDALLAYTEIFSSNLDRLAEKEFTKLLSTVGIAPGREATMIESLSGKKFTVAQQLELSPSVETFMLRYGKSETVKDNREFVYQLMGALGVVQEVDMEKMDRLLNYIKDINKLKTLVSEVKGVAGGTRLNFANNPGLKSLSKLSVVEPSEILLANTAFQNPKDLADCNLRELDLSNTPVTSIKSLKNYELLMLNLSGTQLAELPSMKRYSELKVLNLSNTPIVSVQPLIGSQIEVLDIRGCKDISDVRLLSRIPSLHTIYLSKNIENIWSLNSMQQLKTVGWNPGSPKAAESFWRDYSDEATQRMRSQYGPRLLGIIQEIARNVPIERDWESPERLVERCRYYPDGISFEFRNVHGISDLSPLKGIPVVSLNVEQTGVRDLTPLAEAPLKRLWVSGTKVPTLKTIPNCPLEEVYFRGTPIDPEELQDAWPNLSVLVFDGDQLKDLKFLGEKQLTNLSIYGGKFSRPDPLVEQPLSSLRLENTPIRSLQPFSEIATLRHLYVRGTLVSSVTHLKSTQLISLDISETDVRDLLPLSDCPLENIWFNKTKVSNINFVEGKKLKVLAMQDCEIRDIELLKNMPLRTLHIGGTKIKDYAPIGTLSNLETIWLDDTEFDDLTLLHGKPIQELRLDNCKKIHSITPLASLKRMRNLTIPRRDIDGIRVVWQLPRLRRLNDRFDNWRMSLERYFE